MNKIILTFPESSPQSYSRNNLQKNPQLFIVMGVSGSGKSTIARQLAQDYSWAFVDADDFHSEQAKELMAANLPLTDEMRAPWITAIVSHLSLLFKQGKSVSLAYSGLKKRHRSVFRNLSYSCHFFYLQGDKKTLQERMNKRKNHFFSAELLNSQFEAMQPPGDDEKDVSIIEINRPVLVVSKVIDSLAKQILKSHKITQ